MKQFTLKFIVLSILVIFSSNVSSQTKKLLLADERAFFKALDFGLEGMETVKEAVAKGDYLAARKEYLNYRRIHSKTKWFIGAVEGVNSSSSVNVPLLDSLSNNYIVDNISVHPYVPYWVNMGRDFNWTHNPLASTDPNFSREWSWVVVARMKFLNQLTDGYRKTGEEKYAAKAINLLWDFHQKASLSIDSKTNKELLWRGLETAIRSSVLANVYYSVKDRATFSAEDQTMFGSLAYQHGERLFSIVNADTLRTGNHVTTESYGLFVIGSIFPEFKASAAWRELAIKRFKREIDRVVPPDGLQAELSPGYHYGVVAPYHGFYDVAAMNNIKLPDGFLSRLKDMYRAPVLIMDQSGGFVATNDSSPKDVRKLSKRGLDLGEDPLLLWAASGGKKGIAPPTSTELPYAGFYTMRSGWKPNDLFLFFRGGPEGIGHAEQDMLQVVLRAYGKTLLFDPGKYPYDQSDWRRFSINTPSHNTIIVDGKWQNREKKAPEKYLPTGNPWSTSPFVDFVSATYDAGYETNIYDPTKTYRPQQWKGDRDTTVKHTRKVIYLKPEYVVVVDELDGTGKHTFDAHFHIDAPAAKLDNVTQAIVSERKDSIQIALYPLNRQNLKAEIVQGQKEPLLGWMPIEQRAIPTARFRKQQMAPATFATLLLPFKGEQPTAAFEEIKMNNKAAWGQLISSAKVDAEVYVVKGKQQLELTFKSSLMGKTTFKSNGLVVRKNKDQQSLCVAGWNMSEFSDAYTTFSTSSPTTINLVERKGYLTIGNLGDQTVEVTFSYPLKKSIRLGAGEWMDVSGRGHKTVGEPKSVAKF